MKKSILVTGGARSGKSAFAEQLICRLGSDPVYIATADAGDSEMAARIAEHRARRGPEWKVREAPLDLAAALIETDGTSPRLVDCLTLWLNNQMFSGRDLSEQTQALAEAVARQTAPVILVTNEVGAGIVPDNPLARAFRDEAGRLNQAIATVTDEVWLVVSGQPLKVKPHDYNF